MSDALRIHITAGDPTPLHRQIARQVRLAVADRTLRDGDAMPSVRALAERLTINPGTVARAYADLTSEGVTASRPGKGVFVAAPRKRLTAAERNRRLDAKADELVHAAVELGVGADAAIERLRARFAALGVEGLEPRS